MFKFCYLLYYIVGLSPSKKNFFICCNDSPSKMKKKCFLFHLKSSFRSQDIYIFFLAFWACIKNGLIIKIRLISKFMTSQLKLYTIDPDICSILTFQIRFWEQFLQHILCIIFQQKSFSCYILLTDQISLSGSFYFQRY